MALPLCRTTALELVYLRSLGGTGYVALTMAVCIGCLRPVTLGDPTAIVWLDVSQTVWHVLVAQLAFGAIADAMVWAVERKGLRHFELPAQFAAGYPLSNMAFIDFDLKGYALAFGMGGMFIYAVALAFLGPAFVTGVCRALPAERNAGLGSACTRVCKRDCGGLLNQATFSTVS